MSRGFMLPKLRALEFGAMRLKAVVAVAHDQQLRVSNPDDFRLRIQKISLGPRVNGWSA